MKEKRNSRVVVGKRSGPSLHSCDCHLHFLRTDVKSENGFMIHSPVRLKATKRILHEIPVNIYQNQ